MEAAEAHIESMAEPMADSDSLESENTDEEYSTIPVARNLSCLIAAWLLQKT